MKPTWPSENTPVKPLLSDSDSTRDGVEAHQEEDAHVIIAHHVRGAPKATTAARRSAAATVTGMRAGRLTA